MIIPDYNRGIVHVHLKISEKDESLSNEELVVKAFATMTGLELNGRYFTTESLSIAIIVSACTQREHPGDVDILASVLAKELATNYAVVTFHKAIFRALSSEDDINDIDVPIIDFLNKYKNEIFTNKSDVII